MWCLYCLDILYIKLVAKSYKTEGVLNVLGKDRIATITSRYAVLFFFFTYSILTNVSSTIAAAYACTDIDPDGVLPSDTDSLFLT